MNKIPATAFYLGLAGLIPFVFGTLTALGWLPFFLGMGGPLFTLAYGTVILSFMSGVLWGFTTNSKGQQATIAYTLSVIPALWAFFMKGDSLFNAVIFEVTGFLGILFLDHYFVKWGLAPVWWMKLRIILSSIVILCLLGLLI